MNKRLLGCPQSMKSAIELYGVSSTLTKELMSSSSNGKLISYQITLLEIFNHEAKKLQKINYCDYEMAYVAYRCAFELFFKTEKSSANSDILLSIKETLLKKKELFESISRFLNPSITSYSAEDLNDPLVARFNNLQKIESQPPLESTSNLITSESISPKQLHSMLNESILLIDYRETKDFDHNHINHSKIINIPPSLLSSSYNSDQDLESKLKLHLPEDQLNLFLNRSKFDYIVLYNYKFGFSLIDLADHLINDDDVVNPSKNPFANLIDLIMFKNKYLSSHLKNYPLYLNGGILNWFETYGPKSIIKSEPAKILPPKASLSKYGTGTFSSSDAETSLNTNSPYLKNFGDYLSTAKSDPKRDGSRSNLLNYTSSMEPLIAYNTQATQTSYITPTSNKLSSSVSNSNGSSLRVSSQLRVPSFAPPSPPTRKNSASFQDSRNDINSSTSAQSQNKEVNSDPTTFLIKYTTGLTNLGNSCYMNSILQCLGATPQLTRFFFPNLNSSNNSQSYRQHININNKLGTKGILTNSFVKLLIDMFSNNTKYFSPVEFKRVVGSLSPGKQFANNDQQDCNEFLTFLLDSLHEDLNQMVISDPLEKKAISELTPEEEKMRECLPIRLASTIEWERYLKLNFSVIVDYFQGQYLSQLKCLECQETSTTYNAFSVLSLPIPTKLGAYTDILLDDCLKEFTTVELLDESNRWRCPNCKRQTKSTKKISITRLPQVLIIHFKRFKISPQGYFNKLDTFIKYPVKEILDLTKYWPPVGTSFSQTQTYTKEREQEILGSLPTRNQIPPFRYKLYGVANHYGNLTTGHYTSYVYKESDSKKNRGWCYFDDAKISYNCSETQVLNKNAYCLFYQRV